MALDAKKAPPKRGPSCRWVRPRSLVPEIEVDLPGDEDDED